MTNALCPGYDYPNRKRFAGQLLDEANKSVDLLMEEELKTMIITLMLDGWSNIRAYPISAVSIYAGKCTGVVKKKKYMEALLILYILYSRN